MHWARNGEYNMNMFRTPTTFALLPMPKCWPGHWSTENTSWVLQSCSGQLWHNCKHIVWYVTHNMSRAMSHVHVLHNCIAVTGWAGVHWCWVTGGDRGRGCTAVRPDTGPPPTSYSIISHLNILHLNLVLPGAKHCHHWHTFKTDIKTAGGKWLYHLDGQRTG